MKRRSFLGILGLALVFLGADGGFLRPVRLVQVSPVGERVVHVQQAVRVGDRYLATVLVTARTPEGRERLKKTYGVPLFLAAAWFSTEWKMLELGDGLFASLRDLTPMPLRGWEPSLLDYLGFPRKPVYRFPEVLVRAAGDPKCPYVIVTTSQVACLDESLRLGSRWETPFQAMDYFFWEGGVWMAGYWQGRLLHRWDGVDEGHGPYEIRPVRVTSSVLALDDLRAFLERRGYSAGDLRDLDPLTWEFFVQQAERNRKELEENPQKLESLMVKDAQGRRYLPFWAHRGLRPFHFPMAATAWGDRAYIVLHRPFGVVVVQMPEGQVLDFWPIRREDLPPQVRDYTRPAVWNVAGVRDGRLFINVELERDVPYRELQATDPAEAARLAQEWSVRRRSRCSDIVPCDAALTPETVVGTEAVLYGLEVGERGEVQQVYALDWSDGRWSRSVLSVPFFPTPDEMWMSVRTEEEKQGIAYVIYGVVWLEW